MSDIYEALLRAELERLRSGGERQQPTPQPEERLAALRNVAASAAVQSPADILREQFPWDRIPVRAWHPDFEHLPALERISAGAEQFRSLRARMYEYRDFNELKSILVTSGQPEEGKSFVALNLALILAQQRNGKVLLIDADLRRYTLNKRLGTEVEPGLADFLAGNATELEVMQRADPTEFDNPKKAAALNNLVFIPAGNAGDVALDLTTSGRLKQLLDFASPAFDWIVIDSSPVNLVSDAVHYARDCDGVLLVVRSGVTKYELAQRAQAEFKAGSVIGVVLNGSTDAPRASYYGYGAESSEK